MAVNGYKFSGQARERLIRGIGAVVAEHGYDKAKISEVVIAANVARKTLYDNFEGKAELFRAMLRRVTEDVESGLRRHDDPQRALGALLEYVDHEKPMVIAFLVAGHLEPEIYSRAIERFGDLTELPYPQGEALVGGIAWTLRRQLEKGGRAVDLGEDFSTLIANYYREVV
jgi:AcrR family transcriptional regulator